MPQWSPGAMGILARLRKAQPVSIYDKIGGYEAIEVVVEDFYVRVLADHQLSGFFTGTNMNRLVRLRQGRRPGAATGLQRPATDQPRPTDADRLPAGPRPS